MNEEMYGIIGIIIGILLNSGIEFFKARYIRKKEKKADLNAMETLEDVLNHKTFIDRSFFTLTNRIGGYSDNEIRKMLMELGAVKVMKEDKEHREWWYLTSRKEERIEMLKMKSD